MTAIVPSLLIHERRMSASNYRSGACGWRFLLPNHTFVPSTAIGTRLPTTGFARLHQFLGNRKATPPVPPILPIGTSTWWEGVKTGRFPQPVKLGPRTTAWRWEDIQKLVDALAKGDAV